MVNTEQRAIVAQMKETFLKQRRCITGYLVGIAPRKQPIRRKMLAEGVEYKVIKRNFDSHCCKRIES